MEDRRAPTNDFMSRTQAELNTAEETPIRTPTTSNDDQVVEVEASDLEGDSEQLPIPPGTHEALHHQEEPQQSHNPQQEDGFCVGDHVLQWCNMGIVPAVYQRHAIVTEILINGKIRIALLDSDEHHWQEIEVPVEDWQRVQYEASGWTKHIRRAGTCTTASPDAPGLVRARVDFLLQHPEKLPSYHSVKSNGECVAVWCKTGTWGTVQATSWLSMTAAGQAKSAIMLSGAAASTQVTVPAAGMWGWLGFTKTVALTTVNPFVLPAIAAYGVVTIGVPSIVLWRAHKDWKRYTIELNRAFWEAAMETPEAFVENITTWSVLA